MQITQNSAWRIVMLHLINAEGDSTTIRVTVNICLPTSPRLQTH